MKNPTFVGLILQFFYAFRQRDSRRFFFKYFFYRRYRCYHYYWGNNFKMKSEWFLGYHLPLLFEKVKSSAKLLFIHFQKSLVKLKPRVCLCSVHFIIAVVVVIIIIIIIIIICYWYYCYYYYCLFYSVQRNCLLLLSCCH